MQDLLLFMIFLNDGRGCNYGRHMVNQLFKSLSHRGVSNKWRIFTILLFELWRKEYKATI